MTTSPPDTNLLAETIDVLREHGVGPSDVAWVGSRDGAFTIEWSAFAAIADTDYYAGHGREEVATDLVVVGKAGWWLERGIHAGSEWWRWMSTPRRRTHSFGFMAVTARQARAIQGWSEAVFATDPFENREVWDAEIEAHGDPISSGDLARFDQ